MKKLRVLVLTHPSFLLPENFESLPDEQRFGYKTEYDVVSTLKQIGHEVRLLGVADELRPIRESIDEFSPDIIFNLLEEFHGNALYDQNVVSYLQLLRVAYTGCNPRGLMLSREKSLAKKLLLYHRIRVPAFTVFPRGKKTRRPRTLRFPLIVKSLTEHASYGVSQASLVSTDQELSDRVAFIHRRIQTDALVEQYIDGREIYVAVLGNDRLRAFPPRELVFATPQTDMPLIATAKVKHDLEYQRRHGIEQRPAENLPPGVEASLGDLSKRIYRILGMSGYARLDYRLSADGALWFLEANPNPEIAMSEEFASAAQQSGISYPDLIGRILSNGLSAAR